LDTEMIPDALMLGIWRGRICPEKSRQGSIFIRKRRIE
jgi:hypothetical protein